MAMYHCELTVNLVGMEPWVAEVIKSMKPLPHFTHQFKVTSVFTGMGHLLDQVIIINAKVGMTPAVLRLLAGDRNICIWVTEQPEALKKEELSCLDYIWPLPLNEALVRFYFSRLQQQLKKNKDLWLTDQYLEDVIDTLPDMVWFKDAKGAHLKVNNAFCSAVGKSKKDIQGRGHYYIWGLTKEQYEKGEFVCLETEKAVMEARKTCVFDEKVLAKDGLRELKTYKTPIFDESGEKVLGTLGIARDVTRENRYKKMIVDMANTDDLTGLANRRHFVSYYAEKRKQRPVTMMYLDVDFFKQINDTFGHAIGDEALILVADSMTKFFPDAFITRLGGDEFLITYFGAVDWQKMQDNVGRLQSALNRWHHKPMSLSIGIAYTDNSAVTMDELLYASDEALYQSKRQGKGRCCLYNKKGARTQSGKLLELGETTQTWKF